MDEHEQNENLKKKIASLENQIHELEKDLIHDSLTGLRTRAFFEEEFNIYLSAIENVKSTKRREWFGFTNISILFFDVDHFKKVNDTYGHDVGDLVLKEVAQVIAKSVRDGDTVARWGGEEIIASLLGANEEDAKNKAEEIRKKVGALTFDTQPDLKVTISVGVANSFPGATLSELTKNADLCLYKAKRSGRNQVVAYSEIKE